MRHLILRVKGVPLPLDEAGGQHVFYDYGTIRQCRVPLIEMRLAGGGHVDDTVTAAPHVRLDGIIRRNADKIGVEPAQLHDGGDLVPENEVGIVEADGDVIRTG